MPGFGLLAHAAPISYRFPLPIWIYVVAAGAAVLASAPAAAAAVSGGGRALRTRNLYPALRPLRLGPAGLTLCSLLLAVAFVGGFGGSSVQAAEFFENPMTVLVWIDFWVGLGVVSALAGNVWDFVSPLNAAARALDRALARRGISSLPYPERLGRLPAVAGLLVWSWAELVWAPAKEPRTLAVIGAAYLLLNLAASGVFGARAWLDNAEVFTVVARTFARFAPFELSPASPEEWLAAPREEREVRLRPYGAGLRSEQPLPPGGGAFVACLLATVVYDGFSQTNRFATLEAWFLRHWSWLGAHTQLLEGALMLAIVVLFALAFAAVCGRNAALYAPTLIPIAAVYFIAHYFAYLLIGGQSTLGVVVDPLGKSWNPDGLGEYGLWKGIAPATGVWWAQVVLIVWGHVSGVFEAHRVSLHAGGRGRAVLVSQAPLVLLMVGYTMAGLWVLAQQIKA